MQAAARLGHAKWDMLRVVAMMRGSFADQRTAVSRYCTALRDRPWRWRADVRTAGAWVYEADEGLSPMSRSLHGVLFDQHKPPTEWCTSAIAALSVGVPVPPSLYDSLWPNRRLDSVPPARLDTVLTQRRKLDIACNTTEGHYRCDQHNVGSHLAAFGWVWRGPSQA